MTLDTKTLKTLAKHKSIKQADIARITGLPKNSISRYFSGVYKPSMERLKMITDVLGISVDSVIIKPKADPILEVPPQQKFNVNFCPYCGEDLQGW